MKVNHRAWEVSLCAVFFASGASALVFETLWFHQAGIALGNSVWASSLVLSGFMAGLAMGNALAARRGDLARNPVLLYAGLEVAIGATGVGLVTLLPLLGPLLAPWFRPILDVPWLLNPLRLGTAFALLLVPSTAMGMTLPLLARALAARDPNFGSALGKLYGWNTLGAVLGAVAAETHLIPILGIHGSAWASCALNVVAALGALALSRPISGAPARTQAGRRPVPWRGRIRWMAAGFGSGFALLALEVVWFRFLSLFVLSRSLSFAVMLAVVLLGISMGGLAASYWLRRLWDAHRFATCIAFGLGALTAATYAFFLPLASWGAGRHDLQDVGGILRLAIPLMLPVSFASGIFFTLAGAGIRGRVDSASQAAGLLTLANTVGAALGALAAGFFLLPTFGVEGSLFLLAILYGIIGAFLLMGAQAPRWALVASVTAFAIACAAFPFGNMTRRYLAGLVRTLGTPADCKVVGFREGTTETLLYVEHLAFGRPLFHRLVTNSYTMSATHSKARRYMKLYVYLPVALHPSLKRALLISYGVGSTAKALTDTRSLERIDVVDISSDILQMSDILYPSPASHPLRDPRVRTHVEDGRYFLQTTTERYDLITGEPPPPNLAGVENLYTKEYFSLMRSRLNEGGMVTYWLPIHNLGQPGALAIVRAFLEVFDDASLWHGMDTSLMLVGTRHLRGPVPTERFVRQWRDPAVAPELTSLGFETPEQMGALFLGDSQYLKRMTEGTPPLVDDFPRRILAVSSKDAGSPIFGLWLSSQGAADRFARSGFIRSLWPPDLIGASLPYFEIQWELTYFTMPFERTRRSSPVPALHRALTRTPLVWTPLLYLDSGPDIQRVTAALSPSEAAVPQAQYQIALRYLSQRRFSDALDPLARAEASGDLIQKMLPLRLYALCMAGRLEEARILAAQRGAELAQEPSAPDFWEFMAINFGVGPQPAPGIPTGDRIP